MANSIRYGGFILANNTGKQIKITPDPKRIAALTDIEPPTNRKDLESYLGLVKVLHRWTPAMAEATESMRELLKKDVEFL